MSSVTPSPVAPKSATLAKSSSFFWYDLTILEPEAPVATGVAVLPINVYDSNNAFISEPDVNISVLPILGAPEDVGPLPIKSLCSSRAQPNSPAAS